METTSSTHDASQPAPCESCHSCLICHGIGEFIEYEYGGLNLLTFQNWNH